MSDHDFHPLVKQLLDGDLTLAELPAELRAEGEEALRLLAAADRTPVSMPAVTWRVMAALERRRRRIRPWLLAPALAIAAAFILWIWPARLTAPPPLVTVRFVLVAPDAKAVSLAGTFNQWDAHATPLVRAGATGVWTATLSLPAGQHQYAFVVDGQRWVPDPGAPAVDDGFGRRNSVLTL
ncbi:MAG: glycoside hydrolase family 13 [Gemmatimonadetes bacterium]|nr:MAG: glycoside hydrolase family 13 [Gemmatimonadota bacterium]